MNISTQQKIHGFTLLEVLISMVIFAIGMLGLAGMQGIALKDNNDAYYRSQAVFFAYDLGDRVRANPDFWNTLIIVPAGGAATLTATTNAAEGFSTSNYPFCSADNPPTQLVGTNPPAFCTPTQLAQYDYYQIYQQIITDLPEGKLDISKTDVDGQPVIRIKISWDGTNKTVKSITPSFTYDIRP
jgi:type IV pilus modification protein PilV